MTPTQSQAELGVDLTPPWCGRPLCMAPQLGLRRHPHLGVRRHPDGGRGATAEADPPPQQGGGQQGGGQECCGGQGRHQLQGLNSIHSQKSP